jgi:hypothetical protein
VSADFVDADLHVYGCAFYLEREDGTRERIDPALVRVRPSSTIGDVARAFNVARAGRPDAVIVVRSRDVEASTVNTAPWLECWAHRDGEVHP